MEKVMSYFSYIIAGIFFGAIILVIANYSTFLVRDYGTRGIYLQSLVYGLGYAVILFSILKQKDEWFFYNEYPFKNKLIKFSFFKKKEKQFLERQAMIKKRNEKRNAMKK